MHDLGHPPFGHNGERALDEAMREYGGFEGNAQTLRIVSRLEKKVVAGDGSPLGLDLCYRTLASILKYDRPIPRSRRAGGKLVKGYYETEAGLVDRVKAAVVPGVLPRGKTFKTVECQIMDLADDIAYSTYDLEDALKAGFLTPADIFASEPQLLQRVAAKVASELSRPYTPADVLEVFTRIFERDAEVESPGDDPLDVFTTRYRAYCKISNDSHFRTALSSELVKNAINSVVLAYDGKYPMLSEVSLAPEARERIEVLKQYTYEATIYSSRVKLPEYRGYEVVQGIFKALAGERGAVLMPEDVRAQHAAADGDLYTQMRVVCDFVAGMTDRYAMEFYGRLHSDFAQSMFKPL